MQVALCYLQAFMRRGNQPCSKWLAEDEKIARPGPTLGQDALWMHHSCDGKTIFGLLIGNRMPACNDSSCLCDDIRASLQNLAENSIIQVIGPGNQVNCHQNLRSEEHTSELQSRQYLVCRLLLEKKKHDKTGQT